MDRDDARVHSFVWCEHLFVCRLNLLYVVMAQVPAQTNLQKCFLVLPTASRFASRSLRFKLRFGGKDMTYLQLEVADREK
jgi:hypothetical protein